MKVSASIFEINAEIHPGSFFYGWLLAKVSYIFDDINLNQQQIKKDGISLHGTGKYERLYR